MQGVAFEFLGAAEQFSGDALQPVQLPPLVAKIG
jgi:hypothetical protein